MAVCQDLHTDPISDAFQDADPSAGIPVLRGLLGQVSKRIRSMNDKLTTAEEKSPMHNFWATSGH